MKKYPVLNNDGHDIHMSSDNTRYVIDGNEYVRVGEVLTTQPKAGLDAWKKRLGEENSIVIANALADMGEKIHTITALDDLEKEDKVYAMVEKDEWLLPFLYMWREWRDRFVAAWMAIEYVVWSTKYGVAGRTDRIGVIKGDNQPSSIDIKSGGFWPEHELQLAIYKIMHNETQKFKVERTALVGFNYPKRDGKFTSVEDYVKEKMNPTSLKFRECTSKETETEARKIMKEYRKMFGR
jgi:hypothetical protein